MASVYLDLLLKTNQNQRHWALYSDNDADVDEERYFILSRDSQKYKTYINNQYLKDASGQILAEIGRKLKALKDEQFGMNYIDILIFCLENAEFDKLNVEILDGLINNSLDLLLNKLADEELCQLSSQILEKYLETFLKGEALITEFEIRVGETIAKVFNQNLEVPITSLKAFLTSWSQDYNEDTVLYEAFSKFIHKVMKKSNTMITNEEHLNWVKKLFHADSNAEMDLNNGY
jgi:uncharacterized membrane protein YheB (UPF0754 family)